MTKAKIKKMSQLQIKKLIGDSIGMDAILRLPANLAIVPAGYSNVKDMLNNVSEEHLNFGLTTNSLGEHRLIVCLSLEALKDLSERAGSDQKKENSKLMYYIALEMIETLKLGNIPIYNERKQKVQKNENIIQDNSFELDQKLQLIREIVDKNGFSKINWITLYNVLAFEMKLDINPITETANILCKNAVTYKYEVLENIRSMHPELITPLLDIAIKLFN